MKKKNDFKKLALLGIAGGTMFATPCAAQSVDSNSYGNLLAYAGCGGAHQCGGSGGSMNMSNHANGNSTQTPPATQNSQAPRTLHAPQVPQNGMPQPKNSKNAQPNYTTNYQPQQSSSCHSMNPPAGQYYYTNAQPQQSSGCGAKNSAQGQSYYTNGCGAQTPARGQAYYTNNQPHQSSGCGAKNSTQGQAYYTNSQQPHQSNSCSGKRAPQEQAYNSRPMNSGWNTASDNQPITQWEQGTSDDQRQPGRNQNQLPRQTSYQNNGAKYYMAEADKPAVEQTQLTESQLLTKLNAEGKTTYQGLDPAGKAMALKLANQTCKGKNECKGQNSCKTEKNSCAGAGGCAGTSPGPFKDKNSAVKVAAKKMAEKRANTNAK